MMKTSKTLHVTLLVSFLLVVFPFINAQVPSLERSTVINLLLQDPSVAQLTPDITVDFVRTGFLSGDDFFVAFIPNANFDPSQLPSVDPIALGVLVISGTNVWTTTAGDPVPTRSYRLEARGDQFFLVRGESTIPVSVTVMDTETSFDQPTVDFCSNTTVATESGTSVERTEIELCIRIDSKNFCVKFSVS